MCDQTEVSYLPDDVVWVKLGNVWWPAQVQDETKLDKDVTSGLRKKPLAVVKFWDEDLYEFPKNLDQIYHYNCFKKDEFIRKGLSMCRPNGYREISTNMMKFPTDVRKAEILTGGNPDITNDPKYLPEEKFDYREQFGMKPRKKSSSGSKRNSVESPPSPVFFTPKFSKVKFSTPNSAPSTSRTPENRIYNAKRPLSAPFKRGREAKKVATGSVVRETVGKENESYTNTPKNFKCSYCDYTCGRMGVIIEHYRAHYRGNIFPSPSHIPHNYYKIFQQNFLKYKNYVTSTPMPTPKYVHEKTSVKRKQHEESTPNKKRKSDSLKKEKTPVATPSGSSLAVPIKDIVGPSSTPKKRPRKSKETKPLVVKEPEALDILKDWEDDLDDETEIKLSNSETVEVQIEEASKSKSENFPRTEKTLNCTPQDHNKPQTSKEKCCFDFEDNDESLSLNKSLKFGQKLPRVISEEKPNVQKLLKELQESKQSSSKEETTSEDFGEEFENLLNTTQVSKLPNIPQPGIVKRNEKLKKKDPVKMEREKIEKKQFELPVVNDIPSEDAQNESENFDSIKLLLPHQQSIGSHERLETITAPKNDSLEESVSNLVENENSSLEKIIDVSISPDQKTSPEIKNTYSAKDFSLSNNTSVISSVEVEQEGTEQSLVESCLSNVVTLNLSKGNEYEMNSAVSNIPLPVETESMEVDGQEPLPALSEGSLITSFKDVIKDGISTGRDEVKEIFQNISKNEEKMEVVPSEEDLPDNSVIVEDSSVEVVSGEELTSCKTGNEETVIEQDKQNTIKNSENISTSDAKPLDVNTKNDDRLCDDQVIKFIENPTELIANSSNEKINVEVIGGGADNSLESVKVPLKVEQEPNSEKKLSSNIETPADQIPFDINSMPIVIDQDPIMEIVEGHIEPLPNADIVRLYIRNRGEEEPEDFQGNKRLLTVSPPPPDMPPIPGIKKITLPPPKNKNASLSHLPRYTLSKPPATTTSQAVYQPKIVFIKSTGAQPKYLVPGNQQNLFTPTGNLQPGTRILTTNPHLAIGQAPKRVITKPVLVGKQGFPTTAKIVQKPVISQALQKVSTQGLIASNNTSTVFVNSTKTIVSRPVQRNVIFTPSQLKNPTGVQICQTGGKVVRTAQAVKAQGAVVKKAEAVLPQKSVPSTSTMSETKKHSTKNKQPGPNILQRTQRKSGRQQIVKKSQVVTIPSSVPQASEVVAVTSLPIVQSISPHSSSEPVKMLYLVDNSQYSVENPIIPVENDNRNIFVASTPSSGNIDNIIFSIDGTGNLVNISNQTSSSNGTHNPSQDILAKALANTQVLQSDPADIVDNDNTVYVDQQYPVPSLSNSVLETSLTLNQPPIMTPLEVPSSITPQSNISHIIPITNITKKSDIPQPSMPLLTDEVEVPGQAVFLSDSSAIPTTSGHLTYQLVHDNSLVVPSGLVQDKSSKQVSTNEGKQDFVSTETKEENVLPEFLKGNFGSKSEISKKDTSPKCSER